MCCTLTVSVLYPLMVAIIALLRMASGVVAGRMEVEDALEVISVSKLKTSIFKSYFIVKMKGTIYISNKCCTLTAACTR